MYTTYNFKIKAALKAAVEAYNKGLTRDTVTLFAHGLGTPKSNGTEYVEGPHWPAAHTWYAEVEVRDGVVVGVK